jgi:glycosyltransferase involved in cell wall biosynthesis
VADVLLQDVSELVGPLVPPKRIALVTVDLEIGGAQRVLLDLGAGLVAQGIQVDVVVVRSGGALENELPQGAQVVDLGTQHTRRSFRALRRYLRQSKPDAIISALGHVNTLCVLARVGLRARPRLIVTHHNHLSTAVANSTDGLRGRLQPLIARALYTRADHIVAVSESCADDLALTTGIRRERIESVNNPVRFERIIAAAGAVPPHPWLDGRSGPTLVFVGRLTRQKDLPTLIRALRLLPGGTRLLIIGDGAERSNLESLTRTLRLNDRVAFAGAVDNPYPAFKLADAFVLSSAWEGLPTALIEALAFDTPIVATDCPGGTREVLADGRWGALVPTGDEAALAAAVEKALAAGRAVRPKESRERYDLANVSSKYISMAIIDDDRREKNVPIIYIGGTGRSGSTLLSMLLSARAGVVGVGELRYVFQRGVRDNHLCGCGEPFRSCPFWVEVMNQAFGGFDAIEPDAIRARAQFVDRIRHVPALAIRALRTRAFARALHRHGSDLERLYRAILRVSRGSVIVDSSKDPSYAWLLRGLRGIDLSLIQLVRDPRAVAYSWTRIKHRPEVHDQRTFMNRRSAFRTTRQWIEDQLLLEAMRDVRRTTVRYEDLVTDSAETIIRALSDIRLPSDLPKTKSPFPHSISGNPMRFETSRPVVKEDVEWLGAMTKRDKRLVSILSLPLLRRYGYPTRARERPTR